MFHRISSPGQTSARSQSGDEAMPVGQTHNNNILCLGDRKMCVYKFAKLFPSRAIRSSLNGHSTKPISELADSDITYAARLRTAFVRWVGTLGGRAAERQLGCSRC